MSVSLVKIHSFFGIGVSLFYYHKWSDGEWTLFPFILHLGYWEFAIKIEGGVR